MKSDDVVVLEAFHDADLRVQVPLELLVGPREPVHVHDFDGHKLLLRRSIRKD